MNDLQVLILIGGSLLIFAGSVSFFWRFNPQNEEWEKKVGRILMIGGSILILGDVQSLIVKSGTQTTLWILGLLLLGVAFVVHPKNIKRG